MKGSLLKLEGSVVSMKKAWKILAIGAVAACLTPFSVKKDENGKVSVKALLYKLDIEPRKTIDESKKFNKDIYVTFPGVDVKKIKEIGKNRYAEKFSIEDSDEEFDIDDAIIAEQLSGN